MDVFSEIVGITGWKVTHVMPKTTGLYLTLESTTGHGICPHCGMASTQVRVWYPRLVRDLPISGKACYLEFETRYFDCAECHTTFAESLHFVEAKRDDTLRYETYIFEQVRHTTATYVAEHEGLTDNVVTRIFLRQATARLPEQPFRGVKK